MQHKKALEREVSKRYQQAKKKEKTTILDEMVKITGHGFYCHFKGSFLLVFSAKKAHFY
jgi:L-fucose mutarotase/ribose pyranase (RbsD/FucU family)